MCVCVYIYIYYNSDDEIGQYIEYVYLYLVCPLKKKNNYILYVWRRFMCLMIGIQVGSMLV